jgi:hypothetical protein
MKALALSALALALLGAPACAQVVSGGGSSSLVIGNPVVGGANGCLAYQNASGNIACDASVTRDANGKINVPSGQGYYFGTVGQGIAGMNSTGAGNLFFLTNSVNAAQLVNSATNTNEWKWQGNAVTLTNFAAATLHMGSVDAASPVAQTFGVQGVSTGTMDTAGANWTHQASQSTGSGAGGSFIFQVSPAGGSGTTKNAFATALTIDSTKLATFAGSISATLASATGTNAVCNTPGTSTALTVQVWATGCAASSARFKDEIAALDRQKALEMVLRLQPVSYFYKPEFNMGADKHIGFTAEQVATVDPFLVTFEDDGATPHAVKYNEMAPLFAAAIQQLKAEIDAIKAARPEVGSTKVAR